VGKAQILAVGRTAQAALATLGVEAPALRHPAYGGAGIFRQQLLNHSAPLEPRK